MISSLFSSAKPFFPFSFPSTRLPSPKPASLFVPRRGVLPKLRYSREERQKIREIDEARKEYGRTKNLSSYEKIAGAKAWIAKRRQRKHLSSGFSFGGKQVPDLPKKAFIELLCKLIGGSKKPEEKPEKKKKDGYYKRKINHEKTNKR